MKKQEKKQQEGITLIALVVTIVVMLILAATALATLTGDSGVINNANESAKETEMRSIKEALEIAAGGDVIDNLVKTEKGDSIEFLQKEGFINEDNVVNVKKTLGKKGKFGNDEGDKSVYIVKGNKLVFIDADGKEEREVELQIQVDLKSFITEWKFEAGDVFKLPIAVDYTGNNNFVINWGDGSPEETINDKEAILGEWPTHTYSNSGTYQISITGRCTYFTFDQSDLLDAQASKLIKVVNWGETEARKINFQNAANLETIAKPDKDTFKYYKGNGFEYMFSHCEKLKQIPSGFLDNIPEEINTFKETFAYCSSLTSIPSHLFDNAVNVTEFYKTFYRCTNIRAIPENIFEKNNKINNLYKTFYDLQLIETAPKLWETLTLEAGADTTGCFGSCDKLQENGFADSIPSEWK